jgi:hypothetical protein
MTTEQPLIQPATTLPNERLFTQEEVTRMSEDRRKRDAEALRLKHEENQRLLEDKKNLETKLQDIEKRMQAGTASTQDMQQYQAAEQGAQKAQQQGVPPEQYAAMVDYGMRVRELETKIKDAHDKDPEFAKLIKDGNKLSPEHVVETAFLKNSPAVIKHLMKDPEDYQIYLNAFARGQIDGGVSAQMVLKNISDKLSSSNERPKPSQYQPPQELGDNSDEDQDFNEDDYIGKNF